MVEQYVRIALKRVYMSLIQAMGSGCWSVELLWPTPREQRKTGKEKINE